MQKFKQFSVLLLLLIMQVTLMAQDNEKEKKTKYEFVKTKAFNKSYSVSSSDRLNVKNSFGTLEIRTWNKNEIKIDVAVEVSANSESLAQTIIDGITMNEKQRSGEVDFSTSIKGVNNSKGEKSTMEVNCTVYMPSTNTLYAVNEFGPMIIPDFKGELNATSKFGSLTTGDIANAKSILVEFGKAKFESLTNAKVLVKYSKAEFGKLIGKASLKFEFCNATKINFDNNISSLDIDASYSTVNLRPSGDVPASYNVATSFGSFKNTTGIKFDNDEDNERSSPKFDHKYWGKSGSGSIKITATTNFGKVILGEPGPDDMKEKNKEKNKEKHKNKEA